MVDDRFYITNAPLSESDIWEILGLEPREAGEASKRTITRVADPTEGDLSGALIYAADAKYLEREINPNVAACILSAKVATKSGIHQRLPDSAILEIDNPKAAFSIIANRLHVSIAEHTGYTSDGSASIHETAIVHESAVVGQGAVIGAGVRIGPNSVIGPGVVIGDRSFISANVTVTHALVGQNCQILAGAKIGEAGFGFVQYEGSQLRIPQLGLVRLEDEVEIGANTTVDRGMLADTVIGRQTKIDNLVQVGHNVVIGDRCAIASQTGISGSTTIGNDVMIGGQVGLADHLNIGDGAVVVARAGLMKDVPAGEKWGGYPAKQARLWFKEVAAVAKLTEPKSK